MINIRKNLSNVIGWQTKRRIVVIESDDWGSIRTRSKKDYNSMVSKGLHLENSIFTRNDCLESNTDLEKLFDLLSKFKDSTGRHPVITPMCIMANPDFDRIKKSNFQQYYFENFVDTCNRYPDHDRVLNLWQQGINERLFVPGFHGREHLRVSSWMRELQKGNEGLLKAFEHESFGVSRYNGLEIPEYLGAFHIELASDIVYLKKVIESGAELFNLNCGYKPTHFIAPNRESAKALDSTLSKVGIEYMTMAKLRHYPIGGEKYKIDFNWLGKRNKELNQTYITRNCTFEPSLTNIDYVDRCLKEVEIAFKWKKPAIISSHRVNYIWSIHEDNATFCLQSLSQFLSSVVNKWPDVEFMTSTELGILMTQKK